MGCFAALLRMDEMAQLKVTLVRGQAGKKTRQRETLVGLGLRKTQQTVIVEDTPSMRGMINKVSHLVEVVEV
jgi:large subunit ribosomal protein L30